ncbi:Kinesin light chain 2 [Actinomadura sp. J1-007]|uniref:DUF7779 domain-containing protein n=1 Tax=Actinomadura sp. J1-007 TaxID=2661913 RepID=UPI0013287BC2|nr:NB-ARC domain-containing protein [Actinomadura sp. J1-007]MWK35695.1 Kinesin light chain 2 [Actinomadura sp. J1-007]
MNGSEGRDATARYAAALNGLWEAAGRPPHRELARQGTAQRPPVKIAKSSWSDWINGRNVPSNSRVAGFVVELLTRRARHRDPGFVGAKPDWWGQMRRQALAERRADGGQGGRPPRARPSAPISASAPERCLVGVIPPVADCFQPRQVAVVLQDALEAAGGETVVLTQQPDGTRRSIGRGRVLSGMGGVGKTQLAADFARRAWEHGAVDVLVWVTAASTPAVIDAYAETAVRLALPGCDGSDQEADARGFLAWTRETDRSWLVVLDDLGDPDDLSGWWPPSDTAGGRVLATTRRRDAALWGHGRRVLDIDIYAAEEARSYLSDKLAALERTEPDAELDGLAADLGYLPLALAQAAAYLIDAGITCAEYRILLADQRRTLSDLAPDSLPDDHPRIVAAAWALSIDRANAARPQGLARPLLELLSVLDPNGIPQQILTAPAALALLNGSDHELVRDAVRLLHRFSLVTHNPAATDREIRIHQLIQRATRENNFAPSADPGAEALAALVRTAADALMEVWPENEHGRLAQTLRTNTAALERAHPSALWQNDQAHPVLFHSAISLGETGQAAAALAEWNRLYDSAREYLGPDHRDTLTSRGAVGRALGRQATWRVR